MPTLVRPTLFGGPITPLRGAWAQPGPGVAETRPPVPHAGPTPRGVDLTEDAPWDTGYVYGRMNGTWVPVVPLEGAQMEGPLYAYDDPVVDLEVSTKHYVDNLDIDGGSF